MKEEAAQWLRDFIHEVNTQDNRATATPYYYELRYPDEESGCCNVVGYGNSVFFTEKAVTQYIKANAHNLPDGTYAYLAWGGRNPELRKLLESIGVVVGVEYERK